MSRISEVKVTCSKCQKESDFQIWQSINVQLDPEMKEKVLNGEAFLFKCPECGAVTQINYMTLYHDMEKQFMVYLAPDDEETIKETAEALSETIRLSDDFNLEDDYAKYKLRIVTSLMELQEKIYIFEAGLDDRVIEIMKVVFLGMMSEETPDERVDDILFDTGKDNVNSIVFIRDGRVFAHVPVDEGLYNHILESFKERIDNNPQEYYIYDFDWARNLFRQ